MVHESLAASFLPVSLLQLSPSQRRAHGVQHREQQTPEQLTGLSAAGREVRSKQGSCFPRHDSSHSHDLYPLTPSITGPKPLQAHLWVSTRHSQGNYSPPKPRGPGLLEATHPAGTQDVMEGHDLLPETRQELSKV